MLPDFIVSRVDNLELFKLVEVEGELFDFIVFSVYKDQRLACPQGARKLFHLVTLKAKNFKALQRLKNKSEQELTASVRYR